MVSFSLLIPVPLEALNSIFLQTSTLHAFWGQPLLPHSPLLLCLICWFLHLKKKKKAFLMLGLHEAWLLCLHHSLFNIIYLIVYFHDIAAAAAKSLQSCPTLCDPIDGCLPGSSVPGILQARTLNWVVISFSNAWKWKVKVKLLSRVQLFETSWIAAYQAPQSMGFSRQEYWSGFMTLGGN